jgi:ABC-type dipeptide/oligopeptide/nickel transport system permease subunit
MAVFAPIIAPYDPFAQDIPAQHQMPTLSHPLGTDELDAMRSRIIYGARSSLEVGVTPSGRAIGVSGFRGVIDSILMRMIETLPGASRAVAGYCPGDFAGTGMLLSPLPLGLCRTLPG